MPAGTFRNILLRNISILNPKTSPGVILANVSTPMLNVTFDDVVVTNPGTEPFGTDYYYCENVHGIATGKTWPIPPCFQQE